ncbi:MAG: DUF2711 family protein [Segetibacter sp.]
MYSYANKKYPDDEEIYMNAEQVSWREIKEGSGLDSYCDINKALKTSIGGYREAFKRPDLIKRVSEFTTAKQIYYPSEGNFGILPKKEIFKAFHLLSKTELVIQDEFCQNKKDLNLATLTEKEFVKAVNFKDYFIYDRQKELLFAIDWDDFFFLICSNKKNVGKIISTLAFEGFYCDNNTQICWELTMDEIQTGLQKEKADSEAKEIGKPIDKRPWWKL